MTEKASAENGIRSALIRYLLENSLLVGSLTEWQQESFREFEMEKRAKQKKSWQSLAVFGSEETRREFSRRYRINAERIPFSADAFSVTEECGEFFKRIL